MKFAVFAILLVAVGAHALPREVISENEVRQQRIVENQIRRAIEQISQTIRDNGWDPYVINRLDASWSPQPDVQVAVFIDSLFFSGISQIAIHNLNYNIVLNRLRFDLSLPQVRFQVESSGIDGIYQGQTFTGSLSGNVVVSGIRVSGEVRVNVGIISGISIRSLEINFRLGNIESKLNVGIQEQNFSNEINDLLNIAIPRFLRENQAEIDRLITDIVRRIADEILSSNLLALE